MKDVVFLDISKLCPELSSSLFLKLDNHISTVYFPSPNNVYQIKHWLQQYFYRKKNNASYNRYISQTYSPYNNYIFNLNFMTN